MSTKAKVSEPIESRHIGHVEKQNGSLHVFNLPAEILEKMVNESQESVVLHERTAAKESISQPTDFRHVGGIIKKDHKEFEIVNLPEVYGKYLQRKHSISLPAEFRHLVHLDPDSTKSFNAPKELVKELVKNEEKSPEKTVTRPKRQRRTISSPRDFK